MPELDEKPSSSTWARNQDENGSGNQDCLIGSEPIQLARDRRFSPQAGARRPRSPPPRGSRPSRSNSSRRQARAAAPTILPARFRASSPSTSWSTSRSSSSTRPAAAAPKATPTPRPWRAIPTRSCSAPRMPGPQPMVSKVAYNYTDLTPIAAMVQDEFLLWVKQDAPYQNVQDFLKAVAAKPRATSRWAARSPRTPTKPSPA